MYLATRPLVVTGSLVIDNDLLGSFGAANTGVGVSPAGGYD